MPIYEYRCQQCGHELEKMQKIKDDPLTACPECSAEDGLRRLVSRTSFHLKGGGWYVTDYKKPSSGSASTTKDSSDSGTSEKTTTSSSDSTSTSKASD